eukprot:snap_masked-scaffold_8-processed-gene-13.31-mRNA-1 protein AED:1.00 eAED:1.00 QI:0/-1/0/0/-1/1/1/0/231
MVKAYKEKENNCNQGNVNPSKLEITKNKEPQKATCTGTTEEHSDNISCSSKLKQRLENITVKSVPEKTVSSDVDRSKLDGAKSCSGSDNLSKDSSELKEQGLVSETTLRSHDLSKTVFLSSDSVKPKEEDDAVAVRLRHLNTISSLEDSLDKDEIIDMKSISVSSDSWDSLATTKEDSKESLNSKLSDSLSRSTTNSGKDSVSSVHTELIYDPENHRYYCPKKDKYYAVDT